MSYEYAERKKTSEAVQTQAASINAPRTGSLLNDRDPGIQTGLTAAVPQEGAMPTAAISGQAASAEAGPIQAAGKPFRKSKEQPKAAPAPAPASSPAINSNRPMTLIRAGIDDIDDDDDENDEWSD